MSEAKESEAKECECMFCHQKYVFKNEAEAIKHMEECPALSDQFAKGGDHEFTIGGNKPATTENTIPTEEDLRNNKLSVKEMRAFLTAQNKASLLAGALEKSDLVNHCVTVSNSLRESVTEESTKPSG